MLDGEIGVGRGAPHGEIGARIDAQHGEIGARTGAKIAESAVTSGVRTGAIKLLPGAIRTCSKRLGSARGISVALP